MYWTLNRPKIKMNTLSPLCPSSALPPLQEGQERQVCATQVRPPPVLEDVTDSPRQAAFRVVKRSHKLTVQSQLQDQSIAWQEEVVPTQRNHLESQTQFADIKETHWFVSRVMTNPKVH